MFGCPSHVTLFATNEGPESYQLKPACSQDRSASSLLLVSSKDPRKTSGRHERAGRSKIPLASHKSVETSQYTPVWQPNAGEHA